MGATLRVLATGPYSPMFADHLEYPNPWYESIEDGKTVVTCVIKTVTTRSSEEVAECFDAKLFDFGTHYDCHPDPIKLEQALIDRVITEEEKRAIEVLYENGFHFMLLLDA